VSDRDIDRDWTDRTQLEDALVEEIKAQAARLRHSRTAGNADERASRILRADAENIQAILRSREELVALMEEEISALKRRDGKEATPKEPLGG